MQLREIVRVRTERWRSTSRCRTRQTHRPPLLLSLPDPVQTPLCCADVQWSVERPEGSRSFWVRLPSSYNSSSPLNASFPLLLAYHGLGDTCEDFGVATGFSSYADDVARPFVYVYPCGSKGLLGLGWNAGTCCVRPSKVDDVAFSMAILAELQAKRVRVDASRVWAVGFSNGAMMAETLACSAAGRFAAIAAVSGDTVLEPGNAKGLDACDTAFAASSPTPPQLRVLKVHGTADPLVPWTGDPLLGFVGVVEDSQRWAQRLGCDSAINLTSFTRGHYHDVQWSSCNASSNSSSSPSPLTQLVINSGGTHEWPQDADFDTTSSIVRFLFHLNITASAHTDTRIHTDTAAAAATLNLHAARQRLTRQALALSRTPALKRSTRTRAGATGGP